MSDKNYGTFEKVVIERIAQWTTKDYLVDRTTKYALKRLDEQDIKALNRILDKVSDCAESIIDSLTEVPNIEEESENEDYE